MKDKISGAWCAGALLASVAVLASGCGAPSSSSPATTGPVTVAQEFALARCMRGHGVPGFPDPSPSQGYSASSFSSDGANGTIDLDSSQTQAAYASCRHLLAGGGPGISQLQQQLQDEQERRAKLLPVLLKYSDCMRGHGEPGFPDPGDSGPASGAGAGINPESPQYQAAAHACQHLLPPGAHVTIRTSATRSNAG